MSLGTLRDSHRAVFVGMALWMCLVAIGFGLLLRYSLTPGRPGEPPATWPAASRMHHDTMRQTLVVAVHPHCPCTRATIAELEDIMTRGRGHIAARVVFLEPSGFTDRWVKDDLWRTASAIPGVTAVVDTGGRELENFGAFTSGQVALYDASGHLVFSGGITGARGHVGANLGERGVVDAANGTRPSGGTAPVYGCPLASPQCAAGPPARPRPSLGS